MNWLFLLSANSWGGNEHWTRLAAHALRDDGHAVWVACRREEIAARFDCPTLLLPFRHEADPSTIVALWRLARREGIDVLVPTKRKDYVLGGLVARLTGVPNLLRLGIVRPLSTSVINRLVYGSLADGIIVNARAISETLRQSPFIRPERVRVVYNGVDVAGLRRRAAEGEEQRPHRLIVSSSGMLIRRKGFDRIIRAVGMLLVRRPDLDIGVRITGGGAEMDTLMRVAADAGIADKVHLTGHLENPHPVIAASDVFVMASDNEGISNALLEAMALEVPVISTRAGGAPEAIEHGVSGLLVDDGGPATLANALETMLTDEEMRRRLGQAGADRVADVFSMAAMREGLEAFARERVSAGKRGAPS